MYEMFNKSSFRYSHNQIELIQRCQTNFISNLVFAESSYHEHIQINRTLFSDY